MDHYSPTEWMMGHESHAHGHGVFASHHRGRKQRVSRRFYLLITYVREESPGDHVCGSESTRHVCVDTCYIIRFYCVV